MKELPEFENAIEKKSGRKGVICDKSWCEELQDYLYILEYDEPQENDICGCISDSLRADELELIP